MFANNNCKMSYHRNWTHPLPGRNEEVKALKNEIFDATDKAVIKQLKSTLSSLTVPFRTTWTAGYYIELLNNQGLVVLGMKVVMSVRVYVCMCVRICVYMCACVCVYMCACVHAYDLTICIKCCFACGRYQFCEE